MTAPGSGFLRAGDPPPFEIVDADAGSPFVIVVDHAGRAVPQRLGDLGLSPSIFHLHIAYDIGALGLATRLSALLGACTISQPYSRLVVDCNRAPGQAGSIPTQSDGIAIPGNVGLSAADQAIRLAAIHAPYHRRVADLLAARRALALSTVLLCQHSFTPRMAGIARPWHVGVLHMGHSPMSGAMLDLLAGENDLVVGDNEPYAMDGTDYTAPRHAMFAGDDMLELEVRQDLIASEAGQAAMAERLARLLPLALERVRQSGRTASPSRTGSPK